VAPGAKSSEIALRHGLDRNQLHDWRRQFRSGAVADAGFVASDFVPVVAENQGGSATRDAVPRRVRVPVDRDQVR
jgi:transposase-like protein